MKLIYGLLPKEGHRSLRYTGTGVLDTHILYIEDVSFGGLLMDSDPIVIALAGNPNVGKSTIFNGLTGLRQHTGWWWLEVK